MSRRATAAAVGTAAATRVIQDKEGRLGKTRTGAAGISAVDGRSRFQLISAALPAPPAPVFKDQMVK